jgi:MoaA/NifB/PqqE/SkfB family radical SAM enzyme
VTERFILENSKEYINFMTSDQIPFLRALQIELTSYCNLKCIMCPKTLGTFRTKPDQQMDKETLDHLIVSVFPYIEQIDVVGDGEPLLAKELLLHLLDNANFLGIPVTICSNGQLMDKEYARKLVELNLHSLNISIDASTNETYKKIRGADFDTLLTNIRTLNEIKAEFNKSIPHIHFSMVAMRDNIEELPSLIDLSKSLHVESLTVQALGEESKEMEGRSAFLHHRDLTEEILYRCLIESEADGFPLKLWPAQLSDVLPTDLDLKKFLAGNAPPPEDQDDYRKSCTFLWQAPFVTTNGDIRPCCANLPALGNIGSGDSIRELWFGKSFSKLRRNMLTNTLPKACKTCPGMGWRPVLKTKNSLSAGDEILDHFPGWYSPELDERQYRWCGPKAQLFFHRSESEKFVLLQIRKSDLKDSPSDGTVKVGNETPMKFHIHSTEWETIEFPLPAENAEEILRIELEPSHTIRPVDFDENSRDPRSLGFKLARAWVEEWPQKVVFGNQLIFLGYEIVPESWVLEGDVIFRSFWRSLDQTKKNLKVFLHLSREGSKGPVTSPLRRKLGITRKDFFQADHLLTANGTESSKWVPGTFIAHEHFFQIPENIHPGHYRLELGLYPEGSVKDRIDITRSDRPYEKDRALLGTILLTEREL